MAIGAVLDHGLVFKEEGTPFFCMALETGFIDRVFLHQFRTRRAVGIVAIGTGNFALLNGVMRDFFDVDALLFVAIKADLRLSEFA